MTVNYHGEHATFADAALARHDADCEHRKDWMRPSKREQRMLHKLHVYYDLLTPAQREAKKAPLRDEFFVLRGATSAPVVIRVAPVSLSVKDLTP